MDDTNIQLRLVFNLDGEKNYEYVFCYIDYIISDSIEALDIVMDVKATFKISKDNTEYISNYLGAKLQEDNGNEVECWIITSANYVKSLVYNF